MSGQIRQSRLSGLVEDKAIRADFEEAWTEREETRTAMRGALTGSSSFRALRKAGRKLRRYNAGRRAQVSGGVRLSTRGVHQSWGRERLVRTSQSGWRLKGMKVGSAQCIRDKKEKLSSKRSVKDVEAIFRFFAQHDLGRSRSNNHRGSIAKVGSPVTRRPTSCG